MKKAARVVALLIVLIGPTAVLAAAPGDAPALVKFTILQMNDVYEIVRPADQPLGGLGRVAALRKRLLEENPATFTVLSGDMLSPSPLNGVVIDGQPLAGRQMVSVLNTAGLDLATFGNHELDLTRVQLLQRLLESKFRWISSNVSDASGQPFPNVARSSYRHRQGTERGLGSRRFHRIDDHDQPGGFRQLCRPDCGRVEAGGGASGPVRHRDRAHPPGDRHRPPACRAGAGDSPHRWRARAPAQLRDAVPEGGLSSADRQGRCERAHGLHSPSEL